MIFNSITLENFRVFKGTHQIDLNPGKGKPVVLFGGLNGAGKTSILTAIKLALFGRESIEGIKSKKDYKRELKKLIHKRDKVQCDSASITLDITYSKLGQDYTYNICRSWRVQDNHVEERILVIENSKVLSELNYEQAQGFLYDLVPLGLADLFFFDGEKIKDMADDEDGRLLIDAMKKLAGIDLIERAIHDAGVVIRKSKKSETNQSDRDQVELMEGQLSQHEKDLESLLSTYESDYLCHKVQLDSEIKTLKQKLEASGGAWAKGRSSFISEQKLLEKELANVSHSINEKLRKDVVFSFAPKFMELLKTSLSKNLEKTQEAEFGSYLDNKIKELGINLSGDVLDFVDRIRSEAPEKPEDEISAFQFHSFSKTLELSKESKLAIYKEFEKCESLSLEIDNLGLNIARAPDESQLKNLFESIEDLKSQISKLEMYGAPLKVKIESLLNSSIRLTYDLEKAYKNMQGNIGSQNLIKTGDKVIGAMLDLSKSLMLSKISRLESEFNKVFERLTRKDDMTYHVKIDRESYKIVLTDKQGGEVNKKLISSGEKQIYALSMLEALGKASGRDLPFIIDTPLGRLDSKHRSKLVNNFFPVIGDQVIILSTDTEVDERFYQELNPFICHSYEIKYNDEIGSSVLEDGYFH